MKIRYLLFFVLTTISCTTPENDLFHFDPYKIVPNQIVLSDIADDITYIPLDNTFPIGLYHKIRITNNSIYMSVKDVGMIVFDKDGQNSEIIGNLGRGPGEYLFSMWYAIDPISRMIYILDGVSSHIIKVYSENGNFIREIDLKNFQECFFSEIDFFNNKLFLSEYVIMGKATSNWIVVDTMGNLLSMKKNSVPQFKSPLGNSGGTYELNDRIFYYNAYNDTVFSILPDLTYQASFIISPGEFRLPRTNAFVSEIEQNHNMLLGKILESEQFLIIQYSLYKKSNEIVLFDKTTRKTFLTNLQSDGSGGIENDLDGGMAFLPKSYYSENGREYLVGVIQPFQLKAKVSSDEFKSSVARDPEKKQELEKLAESLNETDNPVLMMVRLKN